jgi:hypothetical protein
MTGTVSYLNKQVFFSATDHYLLCIVTYYVSCRENVSWDVKLALDYKDLQRRIIGSIVTSCTSGLEFF